MSEESEKTLLISKHIAEKSDRGASYTEIDETDLSGKGCYQNSDNSKSLNAQDYNAAIRSRKSTTVINPESRIRKVSTRHLAESIVGDVTPITLSWENVNAQFVSRKGCLSRIKSFCFKGKGTGKPKHVLRDVNGIVKPGTLLAIIGASGAGKTTLMNVLTMRQTSLQVEGTVRVNGVEIGKEISSLSAYCQQDDLFIGTLTVHEHLTFRANLGIGSEVPAEIRKQRVDDVLTEVGLTKCTNTMIGIAGRIRGISGGEAKRLSFASEILTNPALMFCDEPTSGLDSFMALNVVQTLKDMASRGRTIICTIHQPSSEVFANFDQLLILAEGRVAFMGPANEAITFFTEQGYPCPIRYNPADHYIYTMAVFPGREDESLERITNICNAFEQSSQADLIQSGITDDILSSTEDSSQIMNEATTIEKYRAGWFRQLDALMLRSWLSIVREPQLLTARLIQMTIIALVLGIVYLQQNLTQEGVQNINGLLFMVQMNLSFNTLFAVINVFPREMPIFMREHGSRLYRVDCYFLAKNLSELPTFILLPTFYVCIVYWMAGLYPEASQFFIFLAVLVFACNIGISVGYMLSTGAGDPDIALALAPPLLIALTLFGGFYLNTQSVPDYVIWLQYLSWFRYSNEVLIVNQWSGITHIDCPTVTNSSEPEASGIGCYNNGDDVINMMNFSADNVPMDFCLMAALFLGYRIAAFLFLLIRSYKA